MNDHVKNKLVIPEDIIHALTALHHRQKRWEKLLQEEVESPLLLSASVMKI